jgi:crossover junction endodeoxyribonuclease RuvC
LKVLGLDPGATTGFGVVAHGRGGAVSLLECGVIRTAPGRAMALRLRDLYHGVDEVLARHGPDVVAVEGVFYARNARTALVLGHVRGAILLAAALRDLPVAEYSPAEVKNAVVGTGRATKEQIQYMVQRILSLRTAPQPADAADAVAVALCHCFAAAVPAVATALTGRRR